MTTTNKKIKIKVSEVAALLGWEYTTTMSIKKRMSPKKKYQTYIDCEKKLIKAKKEINNELSKN